LRGPRWWSSAGTGAIVAAASEGSTPPASGCSACRLPEASRASVLPSMLPPVTGSAAARAEAVPSWRVLQASVGSGWPPLNHRLPSMRGLSAPAAAFSVQATASSPRATPHSGACDSSRLLASTVPLLRSTRFTGAGACAPSPQHRSTVT
jgi:hypothetical protein